MREYTVNDVLDMVSNHFGDEEDISDDESLEKNGDDYSDDPTSLCTMFHRQYHY